ncbi:flocculation-associated PEP-CTERM protein PepA [Pseudoduganella eburnea]|uniref:Flocculation-associated PEP-CTERM protein PepA n=1 Tax=Massilia eburnea TaxID=1776165 RepID=A0A6L6QFM7_9BURK|nr:flocculation-associated PEP-CTERM protein PepA [Massilia eburnea]MTW10884.1 flocculation-associated PEP-CTERM protein PepA [Massilia eburnea]
MQILTSRVRHLTACLAIGLGVLAAGNAAAAPIFWVNPNSNNLATQGTSFQADAMNGFSSARIVYTGVGTDYTNDGYIFFNGFSLNANSISTSDSRVNFDYGLYATFHQDVTCTGILGPGVTCTTNALSLQLWADPDNDNVYNSATLGSDASITMNGSQVQLAYTTAALNTTAGIDNLGGVYQNITMTWFLTTEGKDYFFDPDPFFTAAFSANNNTSQGVVCDGGPLCAGAHVIAINQVSSIIDFNGQVPEPGVLGLLGIGLLGMAGVYRRKQH